ncbi:MAG: type VI secretion system transmembrane protein TssQ [Tannerella sp.]|jgi:hypothetical protein|nr:type VI secretion system transmembrane protein TssQ [Tannerella sp.]
MRARNSEDVYKAMLIFCYYLAASIVLGVCIFSCFMKTSSVEVYKILSKTQEYDFIQTQQINMTESVDTLYFYSSLLNTDPQINNSLMYNVISGRKLHLINTVGSMAEKDCNLYKRLTGQMNTFLSIKDSIRLAMTEEEMVRADLMKCISDNRNVTRQMAVGGLTYDR